ncbi:hypothetical protein Thal_1489 [Thermocrinis albus DSM 14484]|uniref:Uncharacterized protein n=1 Tax=Thermocrinis albus (strain DSM 14484 / JCM 11386 / HI 11/12) TaxID=638303 RepID=D3SMY8_THEAH|nr:hypothetical protein [Thermocrinis albus]ADC90118.1 hypothetical protein Thal_1489 [Thermocrinis albus DSM 14484]
MKKFLLIIIFFAIFYPIKRIYAGAFGREEGELFISLTPRFYKADKFFDKNGNRKPIGCSFKKEEIELYAEYGISSKDTLIFKVPYQWLSCGDAKTSGFSDIEAGIIRKLVKNNSYVLSAYGVAILPTGYSIHDNPRLGYGRIGLEGGILYGRGFGKGFIDTGIGYRYYFGYPSDQIRGYLMGGYSITKNFQLLGIIDAQIGLGNGKRKNLGYNITLEPDYKLIQIYIGPRILLNNNISINFGLHKVIFGRNTGDGAGAYGSLWIKF